MESTEIQSQMRTVNINNDPLDFLSSFTTVLSPYKEIKYLKIICNSNNCIYISFEENEKKFLLMRYFIKCPNANLFISKETEEFMKAIEKDLEKRKNWEAQNIGLKILSHEYVYEVNNKNVIYEILLNLGKNFLKDHLKYLKNDWITATSLLVKIAKLMTKIHEIKANSGDINLNNLIIDENDDIFIIDTKFGRSVLSMNKSYDINTTETSNKELDYSPGFASPEIIGFLKRKKVSKVIDWWKSDIYSFGILCLILYSCIDKIEDLPLLDKFKNNEFNNKNIINITSRVVFSNDEENLAKKIKVIISNCLHFEPSQRPKFRNIYTTLLELKKYPIEQIENIVNVTKNLSIKAILIAKKKSSAHLPNYVNSESPINLLKSTLENMRSSSPSRGQIMKKYIEEEMTQEILKPFNLSQEICQILVNKTCWYLYYPKFNSSTFKAMGKLLQDNDDIEEIWVNGNNYEGTINKSNLEECGILDFIEGLRQCSKLRKLMLFNFKNILVRKDADLIMKFICLVIKELQSIKLIDFHNMNIGNESANSLAFAISEMPSLRVICLGNNAFTDDGLNELSKGLVKNKNLKRFYFGNNFFSQKATWKFEEKTKKDIYGNHALIE